MALDYMNMNNNKAYLEKEGELTALAENRYYKEVEDEKALFDLKRANQEKLYELYMLSASKRKKLEIEIENARLDEQIKRERAMTSALEEEALKKEKKETALQEKLSKIAAKYDLGNIKLKRDEMLKDAEVSYNNARRNIILNNNLDKKEKAKQLKEADARYKAARKAKLKTETKEDEEKLKKLEKFESQLRKQAKKEDEREEHTKAMARWAENKKNKGLIGAIAGAGKDENGVWDPTRMASVLVDAIGDYVKNLESTIDQIGSKKSAIDTRLYGSKNKTYLGSYWDQMSKDIIGIAGVSPLVKQSAIVEKLNQMVSKGIAYNVEQRAFLETIKDKIATTFNAFDGTLLRLIRIQQQDSTAARLGMESTITAFLNNMYETTEYLSDVASSVRTQLEQAEALMSTEKALSFEYQVQKWLGSLYSVGMSNSAASSIASALGKLSSGDISDLSGQGVGNLVIMAANQSGQSISDLLAKGLDESSTNLLLKNMVNYLAGLYTASQDNLVVQQQLAKVYGMTAADLKAAANLADQTTMTSISNNYLGYDEALGQLNTMANSMYSRTSIGELIGNVFDNFKYSMASGIASSPFLYTAFKGANMLDSLAGGVEFSLPLVMGTGTAQTFNIADIMRVGTLAGSIFSMIGSLASNASAGGGFSGSGMLQALGVGKGTTVQRGSGNVGGTTVSGATTSNSGVTVGNSEGSDIYNKYTGETANSAGEKVAAAEADSDQVSTRVINENIVNIYNLLQKVVDGSSMFNVTVHDYGLTGWNK